MTYCPLILSLAALAACGTDAARNPLEPSGPNLSASSQRAAGTTARSGAALPFHGSLDATETDPFQPPNMLIVHLEGRGTATHLGRYTSVADFTVILPQATTTGGRLTLIAANGDSITATVEGHAVVTGNVAVIVEQETITGGTGRFEGATGSFTTTRTLDQTTGVSSGSFDGTIRLAK